ncbi:Hypothetical_protein [Hexamita inflata]|uniref:Hypothetical_protein n=1 Tax=Hexamita inflata TaxID=28002 RepID=A0AA86QU08_9EUKA|nr:Hypothetical protein HINF_LOCUS38230 [Hexamita inflata]CAI9959553.1 Hypothetical protein HINF_LOCUS47198 [Hexamita inflata]
MNQTVACSSKCVVLYFWSHRFEQNLIQHRIHGMNYILPSQSAARLALDRLHRFLSITAVLISCKTFQNISSAALLWVQLESRMQIRNSRILDYFILQMQIVCSVLFTTRMKVVHLNIICFQQCCSCE